MKEVSLTLKEFLEQHPSAQISISHEAAKKLSKLLEIALKEHGSNQSIFRLGDRHTIAETNKEAYKTYQKIADEITEKTTQKVRKTLMTYYSPSRQPKK